MKTSIEVARVKPGDFIFLAGGFREVHSVKRRPKTVTLCTGIESWEFSDRTTLVWIQTPHKHPSTPRPAPVVRDEMAEHDPWELD
jgi:hypothetical protein